MKNPIKKVTKKFKRGDRAAFAKSIGIAPAYLFQLEHGTRKPTPKMAVAIERETKGLLKVEELCPDVDWAVIRGTYAG